MRWSGLYVCVIASGPSLTRGDALYAAAVADKTIVVNESWRMIPAADVLYAADSNWWRNRRPSAAEFEGERWTQNQVWTKGEPERLGLNVIRAEPGGKVAPPGADYIHTGSNSGFQAMALAVVWGASRIVFLGLDLQSRDGGPNHWHDDYPAPVRNNRNHYDGFTRHFQSAAPALRALGVEVINASRDTSLKCFPRMTIQEALQ